MGTDVFSIPVPFLFEVYKMITERTETAVLNPKTVSPPDYLISQKRSELLEQLSKTSAPRKIRKILKALEKLEAEGSRYYPIETR